MTPDIYEMTPRRWFRPDTPVMAVRELLELMARRAGNVRAATYKASGTWLPSVVLVNRVWTAGRAVQFTVAFTFKDGEGKGDFEVGLMAHETVRLASLDQALRCFLN